MGNSLFHAEKWGHAGGHFYFLLFCIFEREGKYMGFRQRGNQFKNTFLQISKSFLFN